VRPGRGDRESDAECDGAAESDFDQALDRGLYRAGITMRHQQDDNRGDRRDPVVRPPGDQRRQRYQRGHQQAGGRERPRMRDRSTEHRAPEAAGCGADEPIDGRLQRATDARLHHERRRQHRPIDLLDAEQFAEREGDQPGDSDAQAQRDLRAMRGDPVACFCDQNDAPSRPQGALQKTRSPCKP